MNNIVDLTDGLTPGQIFMLSGNLEEALRRGWLRGNLDTLSPFTTKDLNQILQLQPGEALVIEIAPDKAVIYIKEQEKPTTAFISCTKVRSVNMGHPARMVSQEITPLITNSL